MRIDGRRPDELRPVSFEVNYTRYAHGSVLTRMGNTVVLCTAMVEDTVPFHRKDSGGGWLTAEYAMVPSANRIRQSHYAKLPGRNVEIQRIIGRSLRAAVDMNGVGERTLWIDCDVVQGDGGTRTASVTGSYVALVCALKTLQRQGKLNRLPVLAGVAAVSVGVVGGEVLLDLCYEEDSAAEVDMNVVATHDGRLVEVQGTAEQKPFDRDHLNAMLDTALRGIEQLKARQQEALAGL